MERSMANYYKIDELYYPYAVVSEFHESVICPRHMHIAPEMILVSSGSLDMVIADNKYEIPSGYGAFIPPLVPHEFISEKENLCKVITFAKELLQEASGEGNVTHVKNYIFEADAAIFGLVDYYLPGKISVGDPSLAKAVLSPLLYEVSKKCEFIKESYVERDLLLKALAYLNDHYTSEVTLESVAQIVGIHPASLSRLFTQRTGIGFMKCIKYLRATAAAHLIQKDEKTFTEIAYEVGFGSVRSFNRTFTEIYGITPTEYKAKNLQG
jgi:AraC-like DNA-binding protein